MSAPRGFRAFVSVEPIRRPRRAWPGQDALPLPMARLVMCGVPGKGTPWRMGEQPVSCGTDVHHGHLLTTRLTGRLRVVLVAGVNCCEDFSVAEAI